MWLFCEGMIHHDTEKLDLTHRPDRPHLEPRQTTDRPKTDSESLINPSALEVVFSPLFPFRPSLYLVKLNTLSFLFGSVAVTFQRSVLSTRGCSTLGKKNVASSDWWRIRFRVQFHALRKNWNGTQSIIPTRRRRSFLFRTEIRQNPISCGFPPCIDALAQESYANHRISFLWHKLYYRSRDPVRLQRR